MHEHLRLSVLQQNRPISDRFYHKYGLPASQLGFISNFSHFSSFFIIEFNDRPLGKPEHEYRCNAASTDVRSGQEPLIVCMFMSCLCFSQIHSRSSCSEKRSCGKPDLLRINSCSCTNPMCWLRCHLFNWSSMLLLQSESFVKLNAFSLQNDAPLVLKYRHHHHQHYILYLNTIGFKAESLWGRVKIITI